MVSEIATDSKAFKEIIEGYLCIQGVNARVTMAKAPLKRRIKRIVRVTYYFFKIPFLQIRLLINAKKTRSLQRPLTTEPLTLIDTFVLPGYVDKDRYYTGITDGLSGKEKEAVWFVPLLYGYRSWQYASLVKQLRMSRRNFILKEDYLKLRDYLYAWGHIFRVSVIKMRPYFFYGIDISPLVREEVRSSRIFNSSYIALLNYRFARRLKEAGLKLRLVIDWFENQPIDKGWNSGFQKFYPKTPTKGYQGFVASSRLLGVCPTEEEKKNKVIPQEISVIGRGLVQSRKSFCSNLQVTVAPALRFTKLRRKRKFFPDPKFFTILVVLPITLDDSANILALVAHFSKRKNEKNRYWIKAHPAKTQDQVKKAFGRGWPEWFEFVSGDLNDWIEKSDMLVSAASMACFETIARGIPIAIVRSRSGLTNNPVPEGITKDMWRVCYTSEEVEQAIEFYKSQRRDQREEYEKVGKRVKELYFEPVTKEGIRDFLELSASDQ